MFPGDITLATVVAPEEKNIEKKNRDSFCAGNPLGPLRWKSLYIKGL